MGNIEFEDDELSRDGEDGIAGEDDSVEGWIDEQPVQVLLTKVR